MLILAKITKASAGGYAEYLEGKAQASELGDYYLKDGERTEAPGRWAAGAQLFDLDPKLPVTSEELHTLMAVRRPDTGQLLRRAGGSGEAVSAIDATFSAPKSVSAIWALADIGLREQIERAHETAIDRALSYAVEYVPMLRRRVAQDTVVHEQATGLVATSWRHTTARAVAAQAPDPQLHSHVLLHAAVRRDGQIVAIDSRAWLVHQREVGAAYRTELARELQTLGFAVRRRTGRGHRYFELDGVPQSLIDRWSSRHQQVQAAIRQRIVDQEQELKQSISAGGSEAEDAAIELEALREHGQLSPAQERMMGTITRSAKLPVTVADLDAEWRHTATRLGFSTERVRVLQHRSPAPLSSAPAKDVLDALTEFDATFTSAEARAVALERSTGVPIDVALDRLRELRESEQILTLADGSGTTRAHRGRERTVVTTAERLAASRIAPISGALVAKEAERLDRELADVGGRLSDEQREAIRLACGDRQLVIIEGQAGTGKSTTLTGIARAHQAGGQEILVTSTAALAAQRLAADLHGGGVRCEAYSTAALQTAITKGRVVLTPQTTIIHDEAALASTREQTALLQSVEASSARLIAVGDPRQNQPVGAGGLWNNIEQTTREAGGHVELTINQRARDEADRHVQQLFREGHVERAIRSYAARDHVHLYDEQRRAEDHALEAAQADRAAGKHTIVIAQTSNEHLDQLNARAQAIRQQAGELGDQGLPVSGRPYELREGDLVQVRQTLQRAGNGPLRNGTNAEVTTVDADAREVGLQLGDGETVTLTERQIADADLRLAYVQHPFPAQGHTTDTTHLIIGDHTTREGSYVGLTRARQRTDIYAARRGDSDPGTNRLQDLAERMNRSEPEVPSIVTPLALDAQVSGIVRFEQVRETEAWTGVHTAESTTPDRVEPAGSEAAFEVDRPDESGAGRAGREAAPARGDASPERARVRGRTAGKDSEREVTSDVRSWHGRRADATEAPREDERRRPDRSVGYEP